MRCCTEKKRRREGWIAREGRGTARGTEPSPALSLACAPRHQYTGDNTHTHNVKSTAGTPPLIRSASLSVYMSLLLWGSHHSPIRSADERAATHVSSHAHRALDGGGDALKRRFIGYSGWFVRCATWRSAVTPAATPSPPSTRRYAFRRRRRWPPRQPTCPPPSLRHGSRSGRAAAAPLHRTPGCCLST